jgi:hypothetical protein
LTAALRTVERRWAPSARALVIALLLGAAGGCMAALWATIVEAKGLVISVAS